MTEQEFVKNVIEGKKLSLQRLNQCIYYECCGSVRNALEHYNMDCDYVRSGGLCLSLPLTQEEYDFYIENAKINGLGIIEYYKSLKKGK